MAHCNSYCCWTRVFAGSGDLVVPPTWYRRNDNNGWRLVVSLTESDEIKSKASGPRHFSKSVRLADAARQRKQRKREWLMKMYSQGLARERGDYHDDAGAGGYDDGDDRERGTAL